MILIENDKLLESYKKKMRKYVINTADDVEDIISSITPKERRLLGGTPGTPYTKEDEIDDIAKRFIKKVGGKPVAFLDICYGSKKYW